MKKTVLLGASPDISRYSNLAGRMLNDQNIEFVPVGIRKGSVAGHSIMDLRKKPEIDHVHTVTVYLSPKNQHEWYDYILSLRPRRIIFNPGAENPELGELAKSQGIEVEYACNLVLLRTGQY